MKTSIALLAIILYSLTTYASFTDDSTTNSSNSPSTIEGNDQLLGPPNNERWGLGLKLGDPTGLSVKRYLNERLGVEFVVGRTNILTDDTYYEDAFDEYIRDDLDLDASRATYQNYSTSTPVALQINFTFHEDLAPMGNTLPGFEWYYGGGVQLGCQQFRYDYEYRLDNGNIDFRESEYEANLDFGPSGLIGLEYFIPDLPLAIYADMILFIELVDQPFNPAFQGGLGARYLLK